MTVHTPLTVASPAVGSYMWMDPWYGFLGKFARHILNTNRITTCWLINNFLKLYNLSAREMFYTFFWIFKQYISIFLKSLFLFCKNFYLLWLLTFKKNVNYFLFLSNILLTKHISVKAKEIKNMQNFSWCMNEGHLQRM